MVARPGSGHYKIYRSWAGDHKKGAFFNKPARLRELFPSAELIGKEKLGGKDVYVLPMGFEKWYFDAESGLLLRKGNVYYDDYREVDGQAAL